MGMCLGTHAQNTDTLNLFSVSLARVHLENPVKASPTQPRDTE